ncbi:cobalamin-5'-phosphate synthase [Paraglaciecola sp. T6c]|uniref:Adenosylcobinamide-GDP ribazoletransferase n=1 Tax=Pseudoalteromonas atlantica (strain T6c / ATCC BAA-1087) TaxID=3042615 RepID=COBS_PSEA6|nr:adenosylcobinamide-GDP ribazoletransferase [Paraglaciecola sp. T6c]Q15WS4.1 RecName: Full=Adenosylcobinamide-GDP ribazoletransferase; AltName: Full=Cobalamin synthase; AltName: Full=Cobalamin-5'-phosphate synthase [Paraglaciecola sp. T6c]ABG39664.1 cobalamin-5'-phosphate synthase [Paraglaciecola sp. T6c]
MTRFLNYQFNLILLAVSFFTRLPVPTAIDYSPQKLHQAGRYFPLVGWLLAALLSAFYCFMLPYLGREPTVCLLIIFSLMLTGAIHEDGLADTADGFWGGQSITRKLTIMKDSQIGTYGTCALICALLSKFILLSSLAADQHLLLALAIAYPLSRGLAISHVQHLAYARKNSDNSKSDSLAQPMQPRVLLWLLASSVPAVLWLPLSSAILVIVSACVLRFALKHWFKKHIDGYTGDCLGFAQQTQELLIYLLLIITLPKTVNEQTIGFLL